MMEIEGETCKRKCKHCGKEHYYHEFTKDADTNDTFYVPVELPKCLRCGAPNPSYR